jgi:hypothetical protein
MSLLATLQGSTFKKYMLNNCPPNCPLCSREILEEKEILNDEEFVEDDQLDYEEASDDSCVIENKTNE